LVDPEFAKGIVCGLEIAPTTNTPHIQGFVRWHKPRSFKWVQRTLKVPGFNGSPHVEPSKSPAQAIEYCKKDGEFKTYGEPSSTPGSRTDLKSACASLLEHRDLTLFKQEHPDMWVRYHRGFQTLIDHPSRIVGDKPLVVWLHGPTGSGKTRYVHEKEPDLWPAHNGLRWFDGYHGQSAVLFDDFRGDWCKFHFLLRILDRYPLDVEIKGGHVAWAPSRIYITSSKHPKDVYNVLDEDVQQLIRRIDIIRDTSDGLMPPI
jgi:hypothetical protein